MSLTAEQILVLSTDASGRAAGQLGLRPCEGMRLGPATARAEPYAVLDRMGCRRVNGQVPNLAVVPAAPRDGAAAAAPSNH